MTDDGYHEVSRREFMGAAAAIGFLGIDFDLPWNDSGIDALGGVDRPPHPDGEKYDVFVEYTEDDIPVKIWGHDGAEWRLLGGRGTKDEPIPEHHVAEQFFQGDLVDEQHDRTIYNQGANRLGDGTQGIDAKKLDSDLDADGNDINNAGLVDAEHAYTNSKTSEYTIWKSSGGTVYADGPGSSIRPNYSGGGIATVLQDVCDELGNANRPNKGSIKIKNNHYEGTNFPVTLNGDVRLEIQGEHQNETRIINGASDDNDIFYRASGASGDSHFFILKDIRLSTDAAKNPNARPINFQGSIDDTVIERVNIRDCGKGIYQKSAWHFQLRHCVIEGVDNSEVLKVTNNRNAKLMGNKWLTNPGNGIIIQADHCLLTSEEIRKMGGPIEVGADAKGTGIVNCDIEHVDSGSRNAPVWLNGSQNRVTNNLIDASADSGYGGTDYCVSIYNDPENIVDANTLIGFSSGPVDDGHGRTRINGVVSDTYTGDETTGRLIDCGFRPSVVFVEGSDGTIYEVRDSGIGPIDGSDPAGELSIDNSGFVVGDNSAGADPNTDTETYTFEARS